VRAEGPGVCLVQWTPNNREAEFVFYLILWSLAAWLRREAVEKQQISDQMVGATEAKGQFLMIGGGMRPA
jgi:hypothetical protein